MGYGAATVQGDADRAVSIQNPHPHEAEKQHNQPVTLEASRWLLY